MKTLRFKEWEIELDEEATKAYYDALTIPDTGSQCYRNYAAYCRMLSPEEKAFFEAMCIPPEKCNVQTIGLDKDKTYSAFGLYCVIGRFLHKPQRHICTPEEIVKITHGERINYVSEWFQIGKYGLDFHDPEIPLPSRFPVKIPDRGICLSFHAMTIPWLLHERCEKKRYYLAKRWQIIKRLYRKYSISRQKGKEF